MPQIIYMDTIGLSHPLKHDLYIYQTETETNDGKDAISTEGEYKKH